MNKLQKTYKKVLNFLSITFKGMAYDLYLSEKLDMENLTKINKPLKEVRKYL